MIIELQKAVVAYLTPLLAANESLAGIPYEVRSAMEDADNPLPEDRHVVAVLCREAKSPLSALRDCLVDVYVGSPVDVEGVTVASTAKVEAAVHDCFLRGATPSVDTLLAAAVAAQVPGWSYAGFHSDGWSEGREETSHLPVLGVKVGLVRAG